MNKLFKLLLLFLVTAGIGVLLVSCEEDYSDKLTGTNPAGTAVDVSSRITGFDSNVSGAGATLTAVGSGLSTVKRVIINGDHATNIEATETSVSFTVPVTVPLGEQVVNFVFAGSERGKKSIEMVPLPVIEYFDIQQGTEGQEINVYGINFDFVEGATIGGVSASVSNVSGTSATLTVPADAQTGPIGLETPAGSVSSSLSFYACDTDPDSPYCKVQWNGNGGFENGTIGVIGEGGDIGGDSFTAGSPGAQWEIVNSQGGVAGLEDLSLKVTINELQNNGNDIWRIQWVNNGPSFDGGIDGFEVPTNSRFLMIAKIWADAAGRVVAFNGQTRTPCCPGMTGDGGQTVTLNQGWNVFEVEMQHAASEHDGGNDNHAAMEINFNSTENLGGVFMIDDVRMVDIGPYQ